MKKLILIVNCFLLFNVNLLAQGFNGSVDFDYLTSKDTTRNVYFVKDKVVKLDQFSKKSPTDLEGSFVFDLNNNNVRYVNPKRKVWGVHKSETPPILRGVCEVKKGSNTKSILGTKCKEYIVKNTEENTIITYWIAESKFNFFTPLITLWNRKDKQSIYFRQIKDLPQGSMPFLSEERKVTDGKLVSKLEITKITAKELDEAKVMIPANYTKFDQ